MLDADAFQAFKEAGNVFDPEESYIAFPGKLPTPDALLEKVTPSVRAQRNGLECATSPLRPGA